MATQKPISPIPRTWNKREEEIWRIATVVNAILDGRTNAGNEFDLDTGTNTTVYDTRLSAFSVVCLMPLDENARARLRDYRIATLDGQMTVTCVSGSVGSVRYAVVA